MPTVFLKFYMKGSILYPGRFTTSLTNTFKEEFITINEEMFSENVTLEWKYYSIGAHLFGNQVSIFVPSAEMSKSDLLLFMTQIQMNAPQMLAAAAKHVSTLLVLSIVSVQQATAWTAMAPLATVSCEQEHLYWFSVLRDSCLVRILKTQHVKQLL